MVLLGRLGLGIKYRVRVNTKMEPGAIEAILEQQ